MYLFQAFPSSLPTFLPSFPFTEAYKNIRYSFRALEYNDDQNKVPGLKKFAFQQKVETIVTKNSWIMQG